jgi:hypothetical protein
MTLIDYYNELGLSPDADISELKRAFRAKAKVLHPDVNLSLDAQNEFIRLHTAYEILLSHLQGNFKSKLRNDIISEMERRQQQAKERAERYAKMRYEKFEKECEAYRTSPYGWIFKILYYGLFYLYMFCAMVFAFVPLWAGYDGGIFYLVICLPLYVLAYFTVKMAYNWKKEIEPLFNSA